MFLLTTTKPSFLAVAFGYVFNEIFDWLYHLSPVGSLGLAIIVFTIIVRIALLPLSYKQQVSTQKTQKMQPELKKIQDKYKDKKDLDSQQAMAQEMNALYAKHGANPIGGCITALVQFPIIIALFAVLKTPYLYIAKLKTIYDSLTIKVLELSNYQEILTELAKIKKYKPDINLTENIPGLLTNLTKTDWNTHFSTLVNGPAQNLLIEKNNIETFCGINLINPPVLMSISIIIPILTVLTTYISIKMTSKANREMDEQTAKMMQSMNSMTNFMLVLIFFSALNFPSGLGLYWALGSIIQIGQQLLFRKIIK